MLGKAPDTVFGKNQLTIDDDIELPGLANGQFRLSVESIFNFRRETHGFGFVVSNVAINDFDFHAEPPSAKNVASVEVVQGREQVFFRWSKSRPTDQAHAARNSRITAASVIASPDSKRAIKGISGRLGF